MALGRRSRVWAFVSGGVTLVLAAPSVALVLAHVDRAHAYTLRMDAAGGALSIADSREGRAVLSAAGMVPGRQVEGTVTLSNSGRDREQPALGLQDVVDRPGPGGGRLSGRLRLVVTDVTGAGRAKPVYDGPLGALPVTSLGTWRAAETRTYRFVVVFPRRVGAGDDAYQGSTTSVGFSWTARRVSRSAASARAMSS